MSGPDIFLSYSREDRAAARHFAESFVSEGFSVWWDAALRSGQTFDEVIEKELRAAKAVVVLWSPRSVASRWVRAEATLADRRNKLVPAIIEACDRPIIFELTHAADLADWNGDTSDSRWRTLVNDLRRLVGGGADDEDSVQPEPAAPPARPKPSPAAAAPQPIVRPTPKPPLADVDDLVFAPARRGAPRPVPEILEPTQEEVDQTQFFKRCDEFDQQQAEQLHCLQKVDLEGPDTKFVVTAAGMRIGRSAPADIIVAGAGVSRAHCLVELVDDELHVSDLNSTNGTYIDGQRIGRSAVLAVGSVLRVGNVSFEHEIRTRAEVELPGSAAVLGGGANPRVARLAGTS